MSQCTHVQNHVHANKSRRTYARTQGIGDNIEKIWVHQFLAKPKTIDGGGLEETETPKGSRVMT